MQASPSGTQQKHRRQKHIRLKRGFLWLALSTGLTFAGIGGWLLYTQRTQQAQTLKLATVQSDRGTVEIAVNASGNVALGNQQELKAPSEVTVEQVLVQVGDRVERGQEIIVLRRPGQQSSLEDQALEIRQQELQLERSHEQVAEAQQELAIAQQKANQFEADALKLEKKKLELKRSQQKITEAEAELEAVMDELKNLEVLNEKGFIAQTELDNQQNELRRRQASLKEAQLDAQSQILELQIQVAEQRSQTDEQKQLQQAEASLRQAQNQLAINQQQLEQALIQRERLIADLQNNIIRSPIIGKILDVKVQPGSGIETGQSMLSLGDPSREVVQLQLPPLEAAKVKPNQTAEILLPGPEGLSFEGQVTDVSPQATQDESGGFFGGAQAGVPIRVQLNQPSGQLIPGSPVEVKIITQAREDVIVLPIQGIQTDESGSFVWLQNSAGQAQKQKVELGLESISDVEIQSGLDAGQAILLPDFETPLTEGQPVELLDRSGALDRSGEEE